MTDRMQFTMQPSPHPARSRAVEALRSIPNGWVVWMAPPRRTTAQNAKLWALLADVSRQVDWHGSKLTPDEWKDVFTAALKRQKVVPGLDGGFVVLGARTSKMSLKELSDLLEVVQAFGASKQVIWGSRHDGF